MPIEVRKPTPEEQARMKQCPTWEKEPSEFPWHYDEQETCLILAGEATGADARSNGRLRSRRLRCISPRHRLHLESQEGDSETLQVWLKAAHTRESGGIGRRAGLRIQWETRAGSSPVSPSDRKYRTYGDCCRSFFVCQQTKR